MIFSVKIKKKIKKILKLWTPFKTYVIIANIKPVLKVMSIVMLSKNNILLHKLKFKRDSHEYFFITKRWTQLLDLNIGQTIYQGYEDDKSKGFIWTRFELPVFLLLQIWHENELNGQKNSGFPTYTPDPFPTIRDWIKILSWQILGNSFLTYFVSLWSW